MPNEIRGMPNEIRDFRLQAEVQSAPIPLAIDLLQAHQAVAAPRVLNRTDRPRLSG